MCQRLVSRSHTTNASRKCASTICTLLYTVVEYIHRRSLSLLSTHNHAISVASVSNNEVNVAVRSTCLHISRDNEHRALSLIEHRGGAVPNRDVSRTRSSASPRSNIRGHIVGFGLQSP